MQSVWLVHFMWAKDLALMGFNTSIDPVDSLVIAKCLPKSWPPWPFSCQKYVNAPLPLTVWSTLKWTGEVLSKQRNVPTSWFWDFRTMRAMNGTALTLRAHNGDWRVFWRHAVGDLARLWRRHDRSEWPAEKETEFMRVLPGKAQTTFVRASSVLFTGIIVVNQKNISPRESQFFF